MNTYEERRERQRRFFRQNLFWIAPLGVTAAAGFFIGLGFLVAWLWRVTVAEIFALRPISFWQAWGLILLSQILFKANVRPALRTTPRRGRVAGCGESSETEPEAPRPS